MILLPVPEELVGSVIRALGEEATVLARRACDLKEKGLVSQEVTDKLASESVGLGHLHGELRCLRIAAAEVGV